MVVVVVVKEEEGDNNDDRCVAKVVERGRGRSVGRSFRVQDKEDRGMRWLRRGGKERATRAVVAFRVAPAPVAWVVVATRVGGGKKLGRDDTGVDRL